jgi:bifunctional DNA-binding transcriptional regulator/antitoxin component of YhaV-PrlF toxin-antitoxin module
MGFPTKVQLINRKANEQWYINFPSAVARAMEFEKGEVVEWIVEGKNQLTLKRKKPCNQFQGLRERTIRNTKPSK